MDASLKALFDAADKAAAKAYAPYSKFSVGAAIRTSTGYIVAGCNVENAAYPAGTCAEAGAIAAMVAQGETKIVEIAIVGVKTNPCYPCGACRQRIFEFSDTSTRVHLRDGVTGEAITHSIDALLPHAFGPRDLA
ncbi:MAG: cytidine deaminase [Alphaproteobacteria bacterium]|jgi:cytidine deaminase|nr:cytidine deaminase [Alphaproteobacteria bacterium]